MDEDDEIELIDLTIDDDSIGTNLLDNDFTSMNSFEDCSISMDSFDENSSLMKFDDYNSSVEMDITQDLLSDLMK